MLNKFDPYTFSSSRFAGQHRHPPRRSGPRPNRATALGRILERLLL